MREKLTGHIVDSVVVPASGNKVIRDSEVVGFALRVTAAGAKSWVLNYSSDGRERRFTIGAYPAWSLTDARREAKRLRREIDQGADPMGERHERRAELDVKALVDRFRQDVLPKRRPSTAADYESMFAKYIVSSLGRLKVIDIRHADVDRLHRDVGKSAPGRANKVIAVVSRLMSFAVKLELRDTNPCRGIERSPEQRRERFLTPAELGRLGIALAAHRETTSANAIRLMLLTGARRGETLSAEWAHFDLAAGVWSKPAASTKQARNHRIPLSPAAQDLLATMRKGAPNETFLFPARAGGHIRDVKHSWQSVCRAAEIEGVRLHDCRHTYAAILASSGLSLPIIGALLGHSQPATTARYAHLLDDPLRIATTRAGEYLGAVMANQPEAEIRPMAGVDRRRKRRG